jgi:putative phosphoserine phosphatase/1-acylglycerol-3-phosphate O-acyltransferase
MVTSAAVFDLDRTLLLGASGPVISAALRSHGLLRKTPVPGENLLFGLFNVIGETLPAMLASRQGIRATRGWRHETLRSVGAEVAAPLAARVEPFAREVIADHRAAGRALLLATTTPYEVAKPFADLLGFDDAIGTRYVVGPDGTYTGEIDGEFVWSRGKARSVANWARANRIDLAESYAYSDSIFDVPMLSMVGHPVAVNPDARLLAYAGLRRWQILWFNAPPGVPKPLGVEPQQVLTEFGRQEAMPWIRLDVRDVERIPSRGGVILASNHRSYLDPLIVTYVSAQADRPVRFLSKKEVTDAPIVGPIATALGAIRVDRGSGSAAPLLDAARALRAGELVAIFPQGTIPRGEAFFDPELRGRHGAVRLALETGCPIVPVGLWGTERAWPRNRKLPYLLNLADPPTVRVRVGQAYHPSSDDPEGATLELMDRIVSLLPSEARAQYRPTEEELRATYPAGTRSESGS